ncbi:hypothetical protein EHO51_19255 (plasmid) [Methylocystis rosea]|uniref:Uncharacterized protein n=1 Tax=Methylocystis rosea TaxID=173366 RepID=A0A3G8MAD0_9HYPH|nr:hypothetical protein EHO51_19255 [Methylocystis rosea]
MISVQAIVLPSNLANPKESQPPEITQLHFQSASYIVMLSMAVFGIGFITFTGQPAPLYWEILTRLIRPADTHF